MGIRADLKFTTSVAAALLVSGCGGGREPDGWTAQRDTAICTDASGKRVADDSCRRQQAVASGSHGASNAFLWYFLARNAVIPPYDEVARGGAYAGAPGRSYFSAPGTTRVTRAGAISRGGFGASAHTFGGARA